MQIKSVFSVFFILLLKGLFAHEPRVNYSPGAYQSCKDAFRNISLTNSPDFISYFFSNDCNKDVDSVTRFLEILKSDEQRIDFSLRLIRNDLNAPILRTVAENFVKISADLLPRNPWLLLSAPPAYLLKQSKYEHFFLFYFHFMAPTMKEKGFWKQQSKSTKRTWSKIVLEPNNSIYLDEIHDLDNFGCVLEEANLHELKNFLNQRGEKLSYLQQVNWSTIRVRKIIELKANNSDIGNFVACFLPQVLPKHVQFLSNETLLELPHCDQTLDDISLPMAIQLFEYFKMSQNGNSNFTSLITEMNSQLIGKLLRLQNNTVLSELYKTKLPMTIVKKFNGVAYSLLQARSVLGEESIRGSTDNLLQLYELIAAIPASLIAKLGIASSSHAHLAHILEHTPRGNKMRAMTISQLYKNTDYPNYIKIALKNNNNEVISSISPMEISSNAEQILQFFQQEIKSDFKFQQRVANLPSYVLKELWPRKSDNLTYENLFNESYPLYLAIMGLDCEIITKIPTSDFFSVFDLFNKYRKLFNKKFPKDLQKCAQMAFLSHLRAKSKALTGKEDDQLALYLDLDDIRSIGGYVITTLPVDIILTSKFCNDIVEEIGRLSLPELMLAVPKHHLMSLTSEYLKKEIGESMVEVEHLLRLGNLIHFFNEFYLEKVRPSALKFILEANVVDTRLCAPTVMRETWKKLLNRSFGPLETWEEDVVLNVGDMLIVFGSSVKNLKESVSLSIADLVKSNYNEDMEWVPRRSPFYKACSVILPNDHEITSYTSSIEELAMFYATSIENLLSTIVQGNDNQNARLWEHVEKRFISSKSEDVAKNDLSDIPHSNPVEQGGKKADISNSARQAELNDGSDATDASFPDSTHSEPADNKKIESTTTTPDGDGDDSAVPPPRDLSSTTTESSTDSTRSEPADNKNIESTATTPSDGDENDPISPPPQDLSSSSMESSTDSTRSEPADNKKIGSTTTTPSDSDKDDSTSPPPQDSSSSCMETPDARISQTTIQTSAFPEERKLENVSDFAKNLDAAKNMAMVASTTAKLTNENGEQTETLSAVGVYISTTNDSYYSSTENNRDEKLPQFGSTDYLPTSVPSDEFATSSNLSTTGSTEENTKIFNGYENGAGTYTSDSSDKTHTSSSRSEYEINATTSSENSFSKNQYSITLDYAARENVTPFIFSTASDIEKGTQNAHISGRSVEETENSGINGEFSSKKVTPPSNITVKEIEQIVSYVLKNSRPDSTSRRKRQTNTNSNRISCNTLKILGSASKFVVPSANISANEIFDCIELLSQMDLDNETKKRIWFTVNSTFQDVNLKFVAGKILSSLSEQDYKQFKFNVSSDWALELISVISENLADSSLSHQKVTDLLDEILSQNAYDNDPKKFPVVATVALGKMICNRESTLDKLLEANDNAISDIWMVFHALDNCPMACFARIADKAEKKFGKPAQWEPSTFTMLGPVAAAVKGILNYTSYLHKSAIECLPSEVGSNLLQEKFINKIPFTSALFLREKQHNDTTSKILNSTEIIMKREWFKKEKEENVQTLTSKGNILQLNVFLFSFFSSVFVICKIQKNV